MTLDELIVALQVSAGNNSLLDVRVGAWAYENSIGTGPFAYPPPFTHFADAAMLLLPPGWLEIRIRSGGRGATVTYPRTDPPGIIDYSAEGEAIPALCAAALKARRGRASTPS